MRGQPHPASPSDPPGPLGPAILPMRRWGVRQIVATLPGWPLFLQAAAAPFLLFPWAFPWLTALSALAVVAGWVVLRATRGWFTRRSPLDWCILLLLCSLPLAVWAAPMLDDAGDIGPVTALSRIFLGVTLFYALLNSLSTPSQMGWVAAGLVLVGVAVSFVGLYRTDWNVGKLTLLTPLYQHLPNPPQRGEVPVGEVRPGFFHPNMIAAILILLIPPVGSLALALRRGWQRGVLLLPLALMTGMLLLTQSRLGLAALALGLVLGWLRAHPHRWPWALGGLGIGGLGLFLGRAWVVQTLFGSGFGTWKARVELWRNALQVLQDFPLTGIGLALFYPLARWLYPFPTVRSWLYRHAHDIFLQAGVDFGYPGLVGFTALLGLALYVGWPRRTEADGWLHPFQRGLWTSLLVYLLFGLFDGLMMWTKPGFLFWGILGLLMAVARITRREARPADQQLPPSAVR